MERIPVNSSFIASVGHDPETNTLHVELQNGKVYEYADIDSDDHRKLMGSDSIGAHFGRHIRPLGGRVIK